MRLSDLLHSEVVDVGGTRLGSVDDVRLVQDGPVTGVFGAALRVEGILIGRGGIGVRLGLHRPEMKGPKLLKLLFGGLQGRARYARWDQVASVDAGTIRLSVAKADLAPVPSG